MSDAELIREERKVIMPDGKSSYLLHDIDWVLNNKNIKASDIQKIEKQHIII
jgi:hypothetical protein